MAMNPIQFQPGMSLSELFEQYGTEAQCEQALEQARWPTGFQCPHCGASEHSTFSNRLLGGMQNISSVGAGLIWSSNRRALSCNSRGNLLACRLLIQCQWQISKFDTKTIAWTDLPWMAGYPTLPYPTLPCHAMKDLFILLVHLPTTIARFLGSGGAKTIVACSLLMKQQILIMNRARRRAPNLTAADRLLLGFWSLFLLSCCPLYCHAIVDAYPQPQSLGAFFLHERASPPAKFMVRIFQGILNSCHRPAASSRAAGSA
jgi:hypothetical protein